MGELHRALNERAAARAARQGRHGHGSAETQEQRAARELSERRAAEFTSMMLGNVATCPLYVRYMKNVQDRERRRPTYHLLGRGWLVSPEDPEGMHYGRFVVESGAAYQCNSSQDVQPHDSAQRLELPCYVVATPTDIGVSEPAAEVAPFATEEGKRWLLNTLEYHAGDIPPAVLYGEA